MKWFALEVILEFITYIWYCVGADIFHFTTNLTIRHKTMHWGGSHPREAIRWQYCPHIVLSAGSAASEASGAASVGWCAHNNVGHLLVHPLSSILYPPSSILPSPLLTVTTHPPRPTHTNTLTVTLSLASEIFFCVTVPALVQVGIKDFKYLIWSTFLFSNFILKQWYH